MAIYIGCSGWHYLHWKGNFYPADTKPANFLTLYVYFNNDIDGFAPRNALTLKQMVLAAKQ